MKVVFIGNVLPEKIFSSVADISPSTNNVQLNYIRYLKKAYYDDLFVYSCNTRIRKIAKESPKKVQSYRFNTDDGIEIITVPFNKKRAIINFSLTNNLIRILKKVRKQYKNDAFVFVVNNHFYYHSLPVFFVKKKRDKVITILNEVLDIRFLPDHRRITFKDYVSNFLNFHFLRRNNGLISFSVDTIKDYKLNKLPYICLFHSFGELRKEREKHTNDIFSIFYGGLINDIYGIRNLLDCMKYLPQNYRLYICGGGSESLISLIKERQREDSRIVFLGLIDRKTVLDYESKCDLLIMIRVTETTSQQYIARYSQPCKIVEYLQSGTPTLATNIRGIPSTLKKYLKLIDDNSPSNIAKAVVDISSNYQDCLSTAEQGRAFSLTNCSVEAQGKSFVGFIDNTIREKSNGK